MELKQRFQSKSETIQAYQKSYRNYCWEFKGIEDLKVAPFHILATEGCSYFDKTHVWHMEAIKEICEYDSSFLLQTPFKKINLLNQNEWNSGVDWWRDKVGKGGEGMVVKPLNFIARDKQGILQPAVKCRGPEYLRIIYGPEYTLPENLERLRQRGLSTKRSLALREFALGHESLERFVRKEPLRKVHECVFGVLALESEPVDPRL